MYRLPLPLVFLPLVLLFLLPPAALPAQTIERGFGLELYPHLSHRRLAGGSDLILDELAALDSLETGLFSYGFGLVYDNRFDRLGYTVGLRYARAGYRTLEQPIGDPFDNVGFRLTTTTDFLSLPLEINFWQDIDERNRVFFFFGGAVNYQLRTRVRRQDFEGGNVTNDEILPTSDFIDYRRLQFSLGTGIGYDRRLGTRLAVRLQPDVRFFLSSNTVRDEVERVSRNYFQLGLRATVRWIRAY